MFKHRYQILDIHQKINVKSFRNETPHKDSICSYCEYNRYYTPKETLDIARGNYSLREFPGQKLLRLFENIVDRTKVSVKEILKEIKSTLENSNIDLDKK
jgi:hypothetical protein